MYARLTRVTADQRGLERWRKTVSESIAPKAPTAPGFVHAYWLLEESPTNDVPGKGLAVTVWADRESLDAAEATASSNRDRLAELTGGLVETWRCRVVAEAHADR